MTKNLQDLRAEAKAEFWELMCSGEMSLSQRPYEFLDTLIDSVLDRAEACAPARREIEIYHGPLPWPKGLEFNECREKFLTNLSTLRS